MRGKKKDLSRPIPADPKYGSVLLAKFINYLMLNGKKSVARSIVYSALEKMAKDSKEGAMKMFETAIANMRPQVEVRSRRVGGANYQVPLPVRGARQNSLAFRWIIGAARNKKGQPMADRLASVLLDAFNNTGDAVKKRDEVHRMADANKAFAHFARFRKR